MREGVLHLPELRADVFFVTLHKTEKDYSPTTMYQDYAINERLFHWQSQSTTSADSPTGRRYVEHVERGYTVLLFGREHKSRNGLAQPFVFLGPARYVEPHRQPADEHHLAAGPPAARAAVPHAGSTVGRIVQDELTWRTTVPRIPGRPDRPRSIMTMVLRALCSLTTRHLSRS